MTYTKLAKYENGCLDLRIIDNQDGEYFTNLINAGFLKFVEAEQPVCKPGQIAIDSFNIEDGKLVQTWEIKEETTDI